MLRSLARDLDADRGVREHLRDAVVQIAREALALFFGDLHDAKPLGRELVGQLHVLERDTGRSGERSGEVLVGLVECASAMVEHLEHAKTPPVARIDWRDDDRARAEAGALVGARVEPRILVRLVDAHDQPAARGLGGEAAAV